MLLGVFDTFLFQPLNKGKYLSISWFATCYCLKKATEMWNNSKFTKELEIFENLTVDGTQYAFHKNWLYYLAEFQSHLQTKSNLYISICQN
jgi:hypothetical protein